MPKFSYRRGLSSTLSWKWPGATLSSSFLKESTFLGCSCWAKLGHFGPKHAPGTLIHHAKKNRFRLQHRPTHWTKHESYKSTFSFSRQNNLTSGSALPQDIQCSLVFIFTFNVVCFSLTLEMLLCKCTSETSNLNIKLKLKTAPRHPWYCSSSSVWLNTIQCLSLKI